MNYIDSIDGIEVTKLRKLIDSKKVYFPNAKGYAKQKLQEEIMFLETEILPALLVKTSIQISEFSKQSAKWMDLALTHKCNALLIYQPLDESYIDRPKIGFVNPRALQELRTFGAMDIFVEMINMDGNGAKVNPDLLYLSALQ